MTTLQYLTGPVGLSDWEGLHALLHECFAYMESRIDPPSSLHRMSPAALCEKANEETLVIVLDGGALIGCGYLKVTAHMIYLGKLAVRPTHRKRGILRKMIEIAVDMARDEGKSSLELETRIELVENHNTFAALGFTKSAENRHEGFDRTTSITMTRRV